MRGKLKYLWSRVSIPMETIKSAYTIFYKHKILLPALPFYRLGKGLALRPKRIQRELKAMISKDKPDKQ